MINVPLHLRDYFPQIQEAARMMELQSEDLVRWLRQFTPEQVHLIIPLLKNFRYVTNAEQLVMMEDLWKRLLRAGHENPYLLSLGPVGDRSGSLDQP